jgi:hypothetical protein
VTTSGWPNATPRYFFTSALITAFYTLSPPQRARLPHFVRRGQHHVELLMDHVDHGILGPLTVGAVPLVHAVLHGAALLLLNSISTKLKTCRVVKADWSMVRICSSTRLLMNSTMGVSTSLSGNSCTNISEEIALTRQTKLHTMSHHERPLSSLPVPSNVAADVSLAGFPHKHFKLSSNVWCCLALTKMVHQRGRGI